jgi:hypothetical protein
VELSLLVAGLGSALEPGDFVTRSVERLELTFEGLAGDRHAGLYAKAGVRQKHHPKGTEIRNARQLSALAVEELREIASALELPEVRFEWLGGNILFEGLGALTRVPPSSRLLFSSGACVAIDDENLPCTHPGKVLQQQFPSVPELASRFVKAAMHKRGLVGWVERPGAISVGDRAKLLLPRANREWVP